MGFALSLFCLRAAESPDPAAVERGRKQFVSSCGFCHGDDATGNRAPDLVRSALVNHDVGGDQIGPVIRAGRPDKGMPGFPFTDSQIADVAAFLHARTREALMSARVPRDYPLAKLLTGNAEAGKAFFDGAGGCAQCHSPAGDLKGISHKYTPLMLQHNMLAPHGPAPAVTVTLPSGEKLTGTLAHLDEFEVALRDADGWYRSWPRDRVKNVEVNDPVAAHRELMLKLTDADVHNLFAYLETL
jgi:cytochrome c oxidase cbb3-type subunit 3